jgi:NAD(P)-dependent dehydrogenase (short-subunit alcohol dehydrogenase family)
MSLQGKYALITGSSRGIGRGIALKLAEQGAKVAINYVRNESAAKDTLAKVRARGSGGFIVQADICDAGQIGRMFSRVKDEFGALDIFVSNARPEVPAFYSPPMEITLESHHLRPRRPLWELATVGSDGRRQISDGMPLPLFCCRAGWPESDGQRHQPGLD